ncbi:hypothetical protein PPIS_b0943 [Pseudoalteromonas piscicida]|uniref:Uncharacterized protein n=1 Tax=Pseudoalteromonas piscicida TaxID=43662 RepID=A0ABM6NLT4_PSEO7|nr:hypothetical protein PPIS_b0943 [Pseudoalteromonas piscicida]
MFFPFSETQEAGPVPWEGSFSFVETAKPNGEIVTNWKIQDRTFV